MALYNVEHEYIEVSIQRQMRTTANAIYRAWTEATLMKQWFMTTARTNISIDVDAQVNGVYHIVDQRKTGTYTVEGIYEVLDAPTTLRMTVGIPAEDESVTHDILEVQITELEADAGLVQLDFRYEAAFPREKRLSHLEYRQAKKTYHDTIVHGFENMFDQLQRVIEQENERSK